MKKWLEKLGITAVMSRYQVQRTDFAAMRNAFVFVSKHAIDLDLINGVAELQKQEATEHKIECFM